MLAEEFNRMNKQLEVAFAGLTDQVTLKTQEVQYLRRSTDEILDAVPTPVLIVDDQETVQYVNRTGREALGLAGDQFEPVPPSEVELPAMEEGLPNRRIGISVQVITEGGTRMGALVTLRDLESIERISRQLQVSERMSALARVTAGVAHEVKNPLNSMRLWLENLKESLPDRDGLPRQAVSVLDGEIDRLDSVVKRFLEHHALVERIYSPQLGGSRPL